MPPFVAWPAAVVLLGIVFMVIFKRPITRFIDRAQKVSKEGIVAAPSAPQRETGSLVPTGEAPALPREGPQPPPALPGQPATKPATHDWLEEMVDAFEAGKFHEADEAFAGLQEQTNDATQRMRNQIVYLRLKYEHGADAGALEKLREQAERPEVSGFANRMIGEGLTSVGQHKEAADAFDKAAAAYSKDEDKARSIVAASNAYFDAGLRDQAFSRIISALPVIVGRPARKILYDGLAALYERDGNPAMNALALGKAVEYAPHDHQTRFRAAYAYQHVGLVKSALLNYKVLLETRPEYAGGRNNYGVAADDLGLPLRSVQAYKQAARAGETLAMANLAYRFMNVGFETEARTLLDEARQKPNVHANVGSAMAALSRKIADEEKHEKDVLEDAGVEQRFLAEFTSNRFESGQGPVDFSGTWISPGDVQIVVSQRNGKMHAEWQDLSAHYRMVGEVIGHTVAVRYERSNLFMSKPTSVYSDNGAGYFLLADSGMEIRVLNKKDTVTTFVTWNKQGA